MKLLEIPGTKNALKDRTILQALHQYHNNVQLTCPCGNGVFSKYAAYTSTHWSIIFIYILYYHPIVSPTNSSQMGLYKKKMDTPNMNFNSEHMVKWWSTLRFPSFSWFFPHVFWCFSPDDRHLADLNGDFSLLHCCQVVGVSQQAEACDVRGTIGTEAAHEFGSVPVEPHHPFLGFPWNWINWIDWINWINGRLKNTGWSWDFKVVIIPIWFSNDDRWI